MSIDLSLTQKRLLYGLFPSNSFALDSSHVAALQRCRQNVVNPGLINRS